VLDRFKNYNFMRDIGSFEVAGIFTADYKCFLISSGKRKSRDWREVRPRKSESERVEGRKLAGRQFGRGLSLLHKK
jgi:hypothetical protein